MTTFMQAGEVLQHQKEREQRRAELIHQMRIARVGGRDLDVAFFQAIGRQARGYQPNRYKDHFRLLDEGLYRNRWIALPCVTTDATDALRQVPKGWYLHCAVHPDGAGASLQDRFLPADDERALRRNGQPGIYSGNMSANTLPLAICMALLKVLP